MTLLPSMLLTGFALVVIFIWTHIHLGKYPYSWGENLLPCIVAISGIIVWLRRNKGQTLTVKTLLSTIFLTTIFYFNLNTFIFPWVLHKQNPLFSTNIFLESNIFFITSLFSVIFFYIILVNLWILIGLSLQKYIEKLFQEKTHTSFYPLSLIIGIIVSSWIVFLLISINSLTQITLLIGITFFFLWQFQTLRSIWKIFSNKQLHLHSSSKKLYLLSLLILLIGINLSETIRPVPSGYDDSTFYYDRIQHIVHGVSNSIGYLPAPFEHLAASISIAIHEPYQMFALALAAFSLFLGTYFFWLLCRKFFDETTSLLGASFFISIPMFSALTFFETKPDMLMLACFLMATYMLVEYWSSGKRISLFLSAFLLGGAIAFKLTALFFAPSWLAITLITEKHFQYRLFDQIRTILLLFFFITLPLVPWIGYYFSQHSDSQKSQPITLQNQIGQLLSPIQCDNTGLAEDYARFDHIKDNSLFSFLRFPWEITMNTHVNSFATEIGFGFLALMPFISIAFFRSSKTSPYLSLAWFFGILILSGLFFWSIFGKQILWYISPLWALLSLMLFFIRDRLSLVHPFLFLFSTVVILASILGNTLVRLKFASLDNQYQFITTTHDASTYLEASQPGYTKLISILNNNQKQRVYLTNTRFWYGIEKNTERAFMDNHLDTFHCLWRNYGSAKTASLFRSLDIRYILFNKSLLIEAEQHPETYRKKIMAFAEFLAQYSRPIWGSPYHMVFEFIPPSK